MSVVDTELQNLRQRCALLEQQLQQARESLDSFGAEEPAARPSTPTARAGFFSRIDPPGATPLPFNLTATESQVRQIAENAPDIVMQVNVNHRIIYVNRGCYVRSREEFIGLQVEDLVDDPCKPEAHDALDLAFATDTPQQFTARISHVGHPTKWYSFRVNAYKSNDGAPYLILTARDSTEETEAFESLRLTEERFMQLAESIDQGLWSIAVDPERPVYINPAFERIWGTTAAEYYRNLRAGEEAIHPEDRQLVRQVFDNWVSGQTAGFDLQYRILRPDGTLRWVEDHGVKIYNREGHVYRLSGLVKDITDRKLAEVALRESEKLYRLLADNSTDMISQHKVGTGILYISPASRTLLGYEPHELLGVSGFDLAHPEDRLRLQAMQASMSAEGVMRLGTFRFRRKDGDYIHLEVSARVICDEQTGEAVGTVAVSRDVTERVKAARLLREREAELAQAERLGAMGQIAAQLAHEINQPLFAIANYAEACHSRLKADPDRQNMEPLEWLAKIAEQSRRVGRIVAKMLQFGGDGALNPTQFDLNQCIGAMLPLFDLGNRLSDVRIELNCDPTLPWLTADRLLIEQVLINLVRNAQEAMRETPLKQRRLMISTRTLSGQRIQIEVQDSGPGVQLNLLGHLFEPFQTTKSQGMGLGLAISKTIILAHEGKISCRNNEVSGATFTVELPAEVAVS